MATVTKTKFWALAIVLTALRIALAAVFAPISFGPVQMRVSNIMTGMLPFCGWPGVISWFLSGMWQNMSSPLGWIDLLSPFVALPFTVAIMASKKKLYVFLSMFAYGFGVAVWVAYILGLAFKVPFWWTLLTVAVGNVMASTILGYSVYESLSRSAFFKELMKQK